MTAPVPDKEAPDYLDVVRRVSAQATTNGALVLCGCGHPASGHTPACQEWWRYPDVMDARQCGCLAIRSPR